MKSHINEILKVVNQLKIDSWEDNKILSNLPKNDPLYSLYKELQNLSIIICEKNNNIEQIENVLGKIDFNQISSDNLDDQLMHKARLAQIGALTTEISHEMSQPLTYLSNYLYLLKSEKNNNMDENLDIASSEIDRLINLVNHLQDFSRKEVTVNKVSVDISELIDKSLIILQDQIKRYRIEISKAIHNKLPKIAVNPNEMEQIILNLLQNAVESLYKNETDPQITIEIRSNKNKKIITISVTDNGEGIDEKIMDKIYKPFFTTKPVGKGTGLGLNIINKLVQKYNGKIYCESSPGEGTCFKIKIPVE